MIASLPMYWRAETAEAWQAFWTDLQAASRRNGLDLPPLTPPGQIAAPWTDHWLRRDLVLSQTCSLPLRTMLKGRVTYVGTFDFGLPGPPGSYHSHLVKTAPDTEIRKLALNGKDSQSGFAAGFEPLPGGPAETAYAKLVQDHVVTGSHAAALKAVATGAADACYVDAVTFRLCRAFDPWVGTVFEAGQTRSTPGLPLITAQDNDPTPLRRALREVFGASPAWIGSPALGGLQGFVVWPEADYLTLPVPEPPSTASQIT